MAAFAAALVHVVRRGEAEGQAELLGAGLEQGRLVAAAGNPAVVLAVFHGRTHDLLDESDLAEHLLDRHRGRGGIDRHGHLSVVSEGGCRRGVFH